MTPYGYRQLLENDARLRRDGASPQSRLLVLTCVGVVDENATPENALALASGIARMSTSEANDRLLVVRAGLQRRGNAKGDR